MADIVRVLRIIEYVGPRDAVERAVADSIHGQKTFRHHDGARMPFTVRAATLGTYPEILDAACVLQKITTEVQEEK